MKQQALILSDLRHVKTSIVGLVPTRLTLVKTCIAATAALDSLYLTHL